MHNARSKDVEYSHLTVTQPNRMERTIQIKLVNRNEKFLKDYDGIPVPTVYLFIHFKNRERDFIISKWRPWGPFTQAATLLCDVMAAILKVWRQMKNPTCQSMRIYVKNISVKFHPDPIWNDRAFRLISIAAARCVAWRWVGEDNRDAGSVRFSRHATQRNATRSRNGNTALGFVKEVALSRTTRRRKTKLKMSIAIWDQFLM